MAGEVGLIPGRFYWVMLATDPDTNEIWEQREQPARFSRYLDDGTPLWHCLNIEGESDWPMRWIGAEIP